MQRTRVLTCKVQARPDGRLTDWRLYGARHMVGNCTAAVGGLIKRKLTCEPVSRENTCFDKTMCTCGVRGRHATPSHHPRTNKMHAAQCRPVRHTGCAIRLHVCA